MYLCGCHDILQPNCLKYWKIQGKVTDHFTILKTCSTCNIYVGKSKTCIRKDYDCYESYVTFEFTISDKRNCDLYITTKPYETIALSEAQNNYAISNLYSILVDKSSYQCSNVKDVASIAIAGFVFLILSALIFIGLIIAIFNYISWNKIRLKKVTVNLTKNGYLENVPNLNSINQVNHDNNFDSQKPIELQNIHLNRIDYNATVPCE